MKEQNTGDRRQEIESERGFVSAPTLEQLRPTPEEQQHFEWLWAWLEASKKNNTLWDGAKGGSLR